MKYEVGNIVKGSVTGIEKYGAFISLDDYYSGLIHISEVSTSYVKNINDYINLGDTINAKVIGVDEDKCHVRLSIKDIDHKVKNIKKEHIQEVGSGFGILKDNLDDWISNKYQEIKKNK